MKNDTKHNTQGKGNNKVKKGSKGCGTRDTSSKTGQIKKSL